MTEDEAIERLRKALEKYANDGEWRHVVVDAMLRGHIKRELRWDRFAKLALENSGPWYA